MVEENVILDLIHYRLIRTTKRITFDIEWQEPSTRWYGLDDGDYYIFTASNGYQVISRSVMDIQTERIWLLGGSKEERAVRSGSMVFGNNEKRDIAYENFHQALKQWNAAWLKLTNVTPTQTINPGPVPGADIRTGQQHLRVLRQIASQWPRGLRASHH